MFGDDYDWSAKIDRIERERDKALAKVAQLQEYIEGGREQIMSDAKDIEEMWTARVADARKRALAEAEAIARGAASKVWRRSSTRVSANWIADAIAALAAAKGEGE